MAYQTWPSTHLVNILIGSSLLYTCMHPIHTYTLHTCTHYTCTHYTCTHYTCTHYTVHTTHVHTYVHTTHAHTTHAHTTHAHTTHVHTTHAHTTHAHTTHVHAYVRTRASIHTRMHTFKFSRNLKIFVQSGHSTNFISTSCTQSKMNDTRIRQ